jgi:hypothetical protein
VRRRGGFKGGARVNGRKGCSMKAGFAAGQGSYFKKGYSMAERDYRQLPESKSTKKLKLERVVGDKAQTTSSSCIPNRGI